MRGIIIGFLFGPAIISMILGFAWVDLHFKIPMSDVGFGFALFFGLAVICMAVGTRYF